MQANSLQRVIGVIGLGYVGLPVAVAFARRGYKVVGFDIDNRRLGMLRDNKDGNGECSTAELQAVSIAFTADPANLSPCDFFIVTVPTPIDSACRPNLEALIAASRTVGTALRRGGTVVYESTVYPGATEEVCVPALEESSGLRCGTDFGIGYSPERINPGDRDHRFENIVKVVSADSEQTLQTVADVYGSVVKAGIHRAPSIKVAEAAKIIENCQRDINIGFVNELSGIFSRLEIDTDDVLRAAATKWNFLNFRPGLVGGHCIGVDPFYLAFQAQRHGYHPEVILSGRRVNDNMGERVAQECIRLLMKQGRRRDGFVVTILGVTFKEGVPDTRNSKVIDLVRGLRAVGISVQIHDPCADPEALHAEYGLSLTQFPQAIAADAVIVAVGHPEYVSDGWPLVQSLLIDGKGAVLDVKCVLDRSRKPEGISLWRA